VVATAIKLLAEGWLSGIALSESGHAGKVDVVDSWRIGEAFYCCGTESGTDLSPMPTTRRRIRRINPLSPNPLMPACLEANVLSVALVLAVVIFFKKGRR